MTNHASKTSPGRAPAAGSAVVVLAILCAGCGAANAGGRSDYVTTVKRMIEVEGRFDEAIALLEDRSERFPRAAPTWYWLSVAYHKKGRHEQAVAAMDRAFSSDRPRLPDAGHASAYNYRGWAQCYLRHSEAALDDFNQALALADKADIRQEALRGRGWVRHQLGRFQEAVTDFSEALELIGGADRDARADAFRGRGLSRSRLRDFQGALPDLDQALSPAAPGDDASRGLCLRGRGWVRYYLGDFEGALQDANQARLLSRDSQPTVLHECYSILAFTHLALGHDPEALDAMGKARAARGPAAGGDHELALIYLVQGQREKAFSLWGGAGWLGVELQDHQQGNAAGARIVSLPARSPAGAAGMMPNDIIVAVDRQPVTNAKDVIQRITPLKPGQTIPVDVLRGGTRSGHTVTIGSAEALMAGLPILAPVLKVRSIPSEPTAPSAAEPQPAIASDAASSAPATPAAASREATVEIDAITITPNPIAAGASFSLQIDLYVENPQDQAEVIPAALSWAIARDGKTVTQFKPQQIDVPNGEPKTLVRGMRAVKTPGHYTIEIELALEDKITKRTASLTIQ